MLHKWKCLFTNCLKFVTYCNFTGKPLDVGEQNPDMNEVEEQFENIELSQDSTETLPVENMLGKLKNNSL